MKSLFSVTILIVCFSCSTVKDAFKSVPEIVPGFTFIPAPNALDKPGTLFAVDKKGIKQPLGTITANILSGTVVTGQDSGKKTSTVGILLKFLGASNVNATADANISSGKEVTYKLKLTGSTQERIELLKAMEELENAKALIKKLSDLNNMGEYQFYLITEAIKSEKLNYTFDKSNSGNVGLNVAIGKVAEVNPAVKWTNADDYSLVYDLKTPLYVFAKYFTISISKDTRGEPMIQLGKQVTATSPLYQ